MQSTANVTNLNSYRTRSRNAQEAIIAVLDAHTRAVRLAELRTLSRAGKYFDAALDKLVEQGRIEPADECCYRRKGWKVPDGLTPQQDSLAKVLKGAGPCTWYELEDICGRDIRWRDLRELIRRGIVTEELAPCYSLTFDEWGNG